MSLTYAQVVDKFILVEGELTYRGKPKASHFETERAVYAEALARYEHRIVHVLVRADELGGNLTTQPHL